MKNRNLVYKRINQLESTLVNLKRIVSTQEPITTYKEAIEKGQDVVDEIRSMIEREPRSAYEQNGSVR